MNRPWGFPINAWRSRARLGAWDLLAAAMVLGTIIILGWGAVQMSRPYTPGQAIPISLNPVHLPEYAALTVMRMVAALILSVLFSIAYAALAAKNRHAEKILIPTLDILQSVPILGYLSITVAGFIALFPGSLLGPECAAIFAVFTSQAWNITFSLYQSFRTVPLDLQEAAALLRLSPWKRFWRLELPHAVPGLVWNLMMSVSGGWFFVVAAEAITVSGHDIHLRGIGSYIAEAITQKNMTAVAYAVIAMLLVIIAYDQLFFRPLLAWSEKFLPDQDADEAPRRSWVLTLARRSQLLRLTADLLQRLNPRVPTVTLSTAVPVLRPPLTSERVRQLKSWGNRAWYVVVAAAVILSVHSLWRFVAPEVGMAEIGRVLLLGLITGIRVLVLIALTSIFWVPIGVWVGMRPLLAQRVQPVAQFLAAFPANLLFPLVVYVIVHFGLNLEIWVSPLMILGAQWYILFNVIGGAAAIPKELRFAARNLDVRGWLWWKRIALPAIFPAYVTGAVTAAGGCWNASIVAEVVRWGNTTLSATGIGAYIAHWTGEGDFPRIVLGITVLALYVVVFNRLFWQRLYNYAAERMRLE